MDRLAWGALLLALSPAAWLYTVFADDASQFLGGTIVILVGLALAGWATSNAMAKAATAGFAIAAFGLILFYLGEPFYFARVAGWAFFAGCIVAAFGSWWAADRVVAGGAIAIAFAGLLWVFADLASGSLLWQPGNLLCLGGGALLAFGAYDRESQLDTE